MFFKMSKIQHVFSGMYKFSGNSDFTCGERCSFVCRISKRDRSQWRRLDFLKKQFIIVGILCYVGGVEKVPLLAANEGERMEYLFFLAGLVLIIKSADVLIDATSKIARRYGVSAFVIGITIVAFGTSAPEFVVGLMSAINGTNQLSLGNIVGSSFTNTALIVGISAILLPLTVEDSVVKREIPMLLLAQVVLAFMILFDGKLSIFEGILLLAGFVGFITYVIVNSKKSAAVSLAAEGDIDSGSDGDAVAETKQCRILKSWLLSAASLIGLFVGGKLAVDGSTKIAANFGLSETVIGLTVVAIATTLPEMMTSIVAARKKEPDIVIGNCVGSNLFNILFVLGLSATINPIVVKNNLLFDLILMIFLTFIVFVISLIRKRVSRTAGVALLLSYGVYLVAKLVILFNAQTFHMLL